MRGGRWVTFAVYVVCALAVIDGLAWITWHAMRLERREHEARVEAARQETARLALWRMDSILIPLVNREDGTPYFHYRSFYSEQQAYNAMYQPLPPDAILVPSPLLVDSGEFVLLHFEIGEDGRMSSPEAPTGNMRDEAEAHYVSSERVIEAEARLSRLEALLGPDPVAGLERLDRELMTGAPIETTAASAPVAQSLGEFEARRQVADLAREAIEGAERVLSKSVGRDEAARASDLHAPADEPSAEGSPAGGVTRTPMDPVWVRGSSGEGMELLLVRRVTVRGERAIQGAWLDWARLRARLEGAVQDVAPASALTPVTEDGDGARRAMMLASVPAILNLPEAPVEVGAAWSPTRVTLILTWAAVIAAVAAIGIVLRASIRLSERRGRFVSAVTHELRTPLTTFCLYTDMLAQGMVGDEGARREYLETLRRESQRLARIVENVLAYARIGSSKRVRQAAPVELSGLVERVRPVLDARAGQDAFAIEVSVEDEASGVRCLADPDVIERVLMNLVDNACKYGADGERRIEIGLRREGRMLVLRVRDHGAGVAGEERQAIFGPFARGRRDDAVPGLGLGLALARGLAREMGGDLRLGQTSGEGATFVLTVPIAG